MTRCGLRQFPNVCANIVKIRDQFANINTNLLSKIEIVEWSFQEMHGNLGTNSGTNTNLNTEQLAMIWQNRQPTRPNMVVQFVLITGRALQSNISESDFLDIDGVRSRMNFTEEEDNPNDKDDPIRYIVNRYETTYEEMIKLMIAYYNIQKIIH
jgi:hypothetical protein